MVRSSGTSWPKNRAALRITTDARPTPPLRPPHRPGPARPDRARRGREAHEGRLRPPGPSDPVEHTAFSATAPTKRSANRACGSTFATRPSSRPTPAHPAVVPGKPDQSPLVQRIFSQKKGFQMPPPQSNKRLSEADKELLKEWVAQGAVYTKHWSFRPPVRPPLPPVSDASWPRNPIDHFVLARLDKRRAAALPGGRQDDPHPPRDARPDRPAPHPGRGRRLPRRRPARTRTSSSSTAC